MSIPPTIYWTGQGGVHPDMAGQTAEAKQLLRSASDWQLVAQIGVAINAGLKGPGAYFVIVRGEDIAARRVERARVTYRYD